ncbi:MAG: thioredoxin domain-containing protein, partial [Pseudonocardiaceae bacterium]|nr:thioredoxin domain-containing protein [Pseudonocardiaceae bacterium]
AFFVEQRDIGRLVVLADVAGEVGLDVDAFRSALESGRYAEAHQQALRRAAQLDIRAVPTFLVGDKRVEGMPSPERLQQLLDQDPPG